jgi:membrane protein YdbS with pleckstrin-like domain
MPKAPQPTQTQTQPQTAPAERVVARLRPHARRLVVPAILLIAISGLYGYFAAAFDQGWENLLVLAAALLAGILLFLLPLIAWLGSRYIVTTRRLVVRRGVFVRVRQELLHSRGYEVVLSQGPLQLLFGSGTLRVATGGETALTLRDVPRARVVQSALHDLMEHAATLQTGQRQVMQTKVFTDQTTAWTGR